MRMSILPRAASWTITVILLAVPSGATAQQQPSEQDAPMDGWNRIGVLNGVWDIAFFINNVTDERALLALDQERGTLARVGYLTNPPRRFGVATRFDF